LLSWTCRRLSRKSGQRVATLNIQTIPGVTAGVSMDTLTAPYNDLDAVQQLVTKNAGQIAAIIIEPVAGNMGCIIPEHGFMEGLREICDMEGIVLIFDEVMTGFRLAPAVHRSGWVSVPILLPTEK